MLGFACLCLAVSGLVLGVPFLSVLGAIGVGLNILNAADDYYARQRRRVKS